MSARLELDLFIQGFTKMEEDFPLFLFHGELVFAEEILELLLSDLGHNVFGFLLKEPVKKLRRLNI